MSERSAILGFALLLIAAAAGAFERTEMRPPCHDFNPLRNPYFGDTHVHTTFSFDAWNQGTRNSPADAYRFARGEAVGIQPYDERGEPRRTIRLRRPLDFAVVTDHAELLGETHICRSPSAAGYHSWMCTIARRWPALGYIIFNSQNLDVAAPRRYGLCGPGNADCAAAAAGPWAAIQRAAEEAYDRTADCRLTTFVGYEWSGAPDGYMIHRNVIFRNATVPEMPANYIDDRTPERLWQRLREECLERGNGCDALIIPHNSNLSGGRLFQVEEADGSRLSRAEAESRARLEVLLEVTQHKGDSECRAGGPSPDELCGFEKLPFARMRESALERMQTEPGPLSYAREILAEGLRQEERLGINPFRLGLIGATDTHLGTPGLVDEDQFFGHAAGRASHRVEVPPLPDDVRMNPGGLAVVWAEENSRDALFEAMRRREVYGTSGPRMLLRFFGGVGLSEEMCQSPSFVADGYRDGVPMGGEIGGSESGAAPAFAVWALRDPGTEDFPGTRLERVQIIKSWLEDGVPREQVYDIAGAAGSGAVDLRRCTPQGGSDQLCRVWRDPDFDPSQRALYYARVVEVPSCRWLAWECRRRQVDCSNPNLDGELGPCCDEQVAKTIQERAWSSPIWYSPR
ncbi:MAG TPA: DUF3604 domain-containing protein [Terriglobales bacterium]|nr:DUF3604 domain-containing protein [Terriglobales bacterium]